MKIKIEMKANAMMKSKKKTNVRKRVASIGGLLVALIIPMLACSERPPKNIILMISDGCGYNHFDAASLFEKGQPGTQVYESFPVQLAVCTASLSTPGYDAEKIWSDFDAVREKPTDSAASATAFATGHHTLNGRLAVDADGNPLLTILEHAETLNKSTGLVTTVPFCHATPAGFASHVDARGDYGQIAQQMLQTGAVDVLMGAGHPDYGSAGEKLQQPNPVHFGDAVLWEAVKAGQAGGDSDGDGAADAWTMIDSLADWQSLAEGPTPKRLFGLAPVATTLQQDRPGDTLVHPFGVELIKNVPSLRHMTRVALNVLDNNPNGFFMMIEGGAVDWASHSNQMGRLIEEQIDFNRAVEAVVAWIDSTSSWSETLLIITADHETGYLTGPGSGRATETGIEAKWNPLQNNGASVMPGHEWHSNSHTNSLVPLFAKGRGSETLRRKLVGEDPVRGPYVTNAGVGQALFELWKSKPAAD